MSRIRTGFTALIVAQAAHSIEEYSGRLWESFPPVRFVSGLISSNHEQGFVIGNIAIVAVGVWCALFPVHRQWRSARTIVGVWAAVDILNGLGHLAWTARQGGYTPGVLTAPVLIAIGAYLLATLRREGRRSVAVLRSDGMRT